LGRRRLRGKGKEHYARDGSGVKGAERAEGEKRTDSAQDGLYSEQHEESESEPVKERRKGRGGELGSTAKVKSNSHGGREKHEKKRERLVQTNKKLHSHSTQLKERMWEKASDCKKHQKGVYAPSEPLQSGTDRGNAKVERGDKKRR